MALSGITGVTGCRWIPESAAKSLNFVLRPFTTPENKAALEVELSFTGSDSGQETLVLPLSWGGQNELYRCITDLDVLSSDTSINPAGAPERRSVAFPPGAPVRLRYTVTQDWDSNFFEHIFRPAISVRAFTLLGTGFLVLPDWDEDRSRRITMDWQIPRGWTQADSFGMGAGRNKPRRIFATISQLQTAVYVGGDYRVHTVPVRDRPVIIALSGKWRFTDREFCGLAQRIISAERGFWHDDAFPYFLITLTPTGERGKDYQGTGLTNSFAAYANQEVELITIPGLKHLLAHELFHTWNPLKLSREGQFPDPQERHAWFGEGFTEYYAHQLLLRSGLISRREYLEHLNERIRAYSLSPVRNAPNERIEKQFFTSDAVGKLPYQRGELLALRWNALIQNATGGRRSLDDVMFALRRNASRSALLRPEQTVAALIRQYTKRDISADIARYVVAGETIPLSADALGPEVMLHPQAIGQYHLRAPFSR